MQHHGSADPTTEGWLNVLTGPGTASGPYTTGGASAWLVSDTSSAIGSGLIYRQDVDSVIEAQLAQSGWSMRVCLQVNDQNAVDGGAASIWYGYDTASRRYDMWFTSDQAGVLSVTLMTGQASCGVTGPTYRVTSSNGSCHVSGFHLFELKFDPLQQAASLTIDGTLTHSGYTGHTIGVGQVPGVGWGAGSSCADGWAAFHLVSFESRTIDTTPPTANAGLDTSIHVSTTATVVLRGEESYDDQTATADLVYAWSFVSTPAGSTATLAGADTATPSFTPDLLGEYRVQLVVTDEAGNVSSPDEVVVSSLNQAPTALIRFDNATITVDQPTSLDGSGSSDPDGDPLTYSWSVVDEPAGASTVLVGAQTATPSFTPGLAGTYRLQLVVNDPYSASTPVSVSVIAISGANLACQELAAASDYLAGMDDSDFAAKGHRNFFRNNIRSACANVQANDLAGARTTIEKLIERTDGVPLRNAVDPKGRSNSMFAADFIEVGLHQMVVYQRLIAALTALQH